MIRPLTIATFLMACGSGLYLYQAKHEVQMLDRTIEHTVHDTAALREQSRLLAAEWTMLNDPERLRQFSDMYLAVKPIAPSQFTSLADLNNRLPAPLQDAPRGDGQETAEPAPVASEPAPALVADETVKPPPPPRPPEHKIAAVRPAAVEAVPQRVMAVAVPRPPEARPVQEARPAQETRTAESRVAPPLPQRAAYAPPLPRPGPAGQPPLPSSPTSPPPFTGSLLGMARGAAPPPPVPRPVPVNATNYYN